VAEGELTDACPDLQISAFAAKGYRKGGLEMGRGVLEEELMQTAVGPGSRAFPTQMGIRVLLLSDSEDGTTACRLVDCGSHVEVEDALDAALRRLCRDPIGYDLFVMDCDGYGGLTGGERAVSSLIAAAAKMRVMLVSRDFDVPALPCGRRSAVCLPVSADDEDFRLGYQHVLRDRLPVPVM
jgi:hypothetical protein